MSKSKIFKALIERHCNLIAKVCNLYTNNQNDFQDCYQDVLLQLWRSFETFRDESKESTWVYRVSLNVCLSNIRKAKRHVQASKLEDIQPKADKQPDLEEKEQSKIMNQEIKKLDESDRAIILLYLEENTYKEMAEIIGISVNHIGVKINRIKKILKQNINERYQS